MNEKILKQVREVTQSILTLNCQAKGGYQIQAGHAFQLAKDIVKKFQDKSDTIDEAELDVVVHALTYYSREDSPAITPAHRIIARDIAARMIQRG